MKLYFIRTFAVLLLFCAAVIPAAAQTAKQEKAKAKKEKEKLKKEKKRWKAKRDKTDPLDFMEWSENLETLRSENEGLQRNIDNLKDASQMRDRQNKALASELEELRSNPGKKTGSSGNRPQPKKQDYTTGTIFKVQITTSRKEKTTIEGNTDGFGVESTGEMYKYTVGYFRDYWEADHFRKYLVGLGLKDAWIVAFKDNQRVDIVSVLTEEDIARKKKEAGID